jgi:preprotein translocase subunit SecE
VARDRKRAKQRRARRRPARAQPEPVRPSGAAPAAQPDAVPPPGGDAGAAAGARGQIERADLPGALEHAGDVDEFDAALVSGAHGEPADAATIEELEAEADAAAAARAEAEREAAEVEQQEVEEEQEEDAGEAVEVERAAEAHRGPASRAVAFLRASWAELQRVQWPDRRQVFQATAVVLGFVAIAGVYLGVADYLATEIVDFIL